MRWSCSNINTQIRAARLSAGLPRFLVRQPGWLPVKKVNFHPWVLDKFVHQVKQLRSSPVKLNTVYMKTWKYTLKTYIYICWWQIKQCSDCIHFWRPNSLPDVKFSHRRPNSHTDKKKLKWFWLHFFTTRGFCIFRWVKRLPANFQRGIMKRKVRWNRG